MKLLYLDCFAGISGVTVVNIHPEEFGVNNGFGAGYAASLINQLAQS
jgi:NCAIR mutase (PurE)-related protein